MTSAELGRDTGNVDTLAELQDECDGDLEIEVWGRDAEPKAARYTTPGVRGLRSAVG